MDLRENNTEIEKLSLMFSKLQNLYDNKQEQLEQLQSEISDLKEVLNFLQSLISNKSFQSADQIYIKSLQRTEENPVEEEKIEEETVEEQYFIEEVPKERVKGTIIKRKIFSSENDEESKLLCVLNFFDFNRIEIKLINPQELFIEETSDEFIQVFLKGALVKIKDANPDIDLTYDHFKNSNLIERIIISNLKSIQEYDLITSKMRELLAKQTSS
ncbi:MAG: hypothetical protein ACFFEN_16575 [Candidatus Thorarchaeota archaeon]